MRIEEQKREREKIIRLKEERRKLLSRQQQLEDQVKKNIKPQEQPQQQEPKQITVLQTSPNQRSTNMFQKKFIGDSISTSTNNNNNIKQQYERHNLIVPTISTNLMYLNSNNNSCLVSVNKNNNNNMTSSVASSSLLTIENDADVDRKHLSSFLNNRKILSKDHSLIDTRLVVVSNLSASTTNVKLMGISRGIGEIEVRFSLVQERVFVYI